MTIDEISKQVGCSRTVVLNSIKTFVDMARARQQEQIDTRLILWHNRFEALYEQAIELQKLAITFDDHIEILKTIIALGLAVRRLDQIPGSGQKNSMLLNGPDQMTDAEVLEAAKIHGLRIPDMGIPDVKEGPSS